MIQSAEDLIEGKRRILLEEYASRQTYREKGFSDIDLWFLKAGHSKVQTGSSLSMVRATPYTSLLSSITSVISFEVILPTRTWKTIHHIAVDRDLSQRSTLISPLCYLPIFRLRDDQRLETLSLFKQCAFLLQILTDAVKMKDDTL